MITKIDDRIEEYETKIKGKFKIRIGDELVAKGKNTWTNHFCLVITSALAPAFEPYCYPSGNPTKFLGYTHRAKVGTDTTTPTDPSMSDLVSPLGVSPSTKSVVMSREPNYKKYIVRYKYTWSPGAISPTTIGEFGVISCAPPAEHFPDRSYENWYTYGACTSFGFVFPYGVVVEDQVFECAVLKLISRVSSADGDFDPIEYTGDQPLIFEWYIIIVF